MKEISILLPSLRPELLNRRIDEFKATNESVDYEIVVVSPFKVDRQRVKWIEEIGNKMGSAPATQLAYDSSDSKYVMYFSDDVSPTPNCIATMLEFLKDKKEPVIGAYKMQQGGREIGPFGAYGRFYACYGCLSRQTAKILGGFFAPEYLYSWVDIDLSLRCWQCGGKVLKCEDAIVLPQQENDSVYVEHREKYWNRDVDTFLNKWHSSLGFGMERKHGTVNQKLV